MSTAKKRYAVSRWNMPDYMEQLYNEDCKFYKMDSDTFFKTYSECVDFDTIVLDSFLQIMKLVNMRCFNVLNY